MTSEDPLAVRAMEEKLRQHSTECDDCAAAPLAVDEVASRLGAYAVALDAAPLSRQVLLCLRPEVVALATAAYRRRLGIGLLAALLLLPVLLAVDAYLLHLAYGVVSTLLPATLAAYLILTYGALLFLVMAATYAAIPLLLARAAELPAAPAT